MLKRKLEMFIMNVIYEIDISKGTDKNYILLKKRIKESVVMIPNSIA